MRKLGLLLGLVAVFLMGCAAPMALDKNTTELDLKEKSVVLLTVDIDRQEASRYHPRGSLITVYAEGEDRKRLVFDIKGEKPVQVGDRKLAVVSLPLAAGKYRIHSIMGLAKAFPFTGTFFIPLRTEITVEPGVVVYGGRVSAMLRPRVANEFRAGPVIPLIDQAATGMADGTWDVSIRGEAAKDLPVLRSVLPVLQKHEIKVSPWPAFDRKKVQAQYDAE